MSAIGTSKNFGYFDVIIFKVQGGRNCPKLLLPPSAYGWQYFSMGGLYGRTRSYFALAWVGGVLTSIFGCVNGQKENFASQGWASAPPPANGCVCYSESYF